MDYEKINKDAAQSLADAVNYISTDEKLVAKHLMIEHRSLQQSLVRVFVAMLEELAKQETWDLRNEASVKLAKKFVERFDITERYLPLV